MTQPDDLDPALVQAAELTAYADGQLEPERAAALERRLAAEPGLAAELEAIRAVQMALRSGLAGHEPPAELDARRRARLALAALQQASRRRVLFRSWWSLATAALVAVVVGLGLVAVAVPNQLESRASRRFGWDGQASKYAAETPPVRVVPIEQRAGMDEVGGSTQTATIGGRKRTQYYSKDAPLSPPAAAPAPAVTWEREGLKPQEAADKVMLAMRDEQGEKEKKQDAASGPRGREVAQERIADRQERISGGEACLALGEGKTVEDGRYANRQQAMQAAQAQAMASSHEAMKDGEENAPALLQLTEEDLPEVRLGQVPQKQAQAAEAAQAAIEEPPQEADEKAVSSFRRQVIAGDLQDLSRVQNEVMGSQGQATGFPDDGPWLRPSRWLAATAKGCDAATARSLLADLLGEVELGAQEPPARWLRLLAGPELGFAVDAEAERPLARRRPRPLRLSGPPRGQALVIAARSAGVQLRPAWPVLALERPGQPFDPAWDAGLGRDGFLAAFATRPMAATVEDPRHTVAVDADTASFDLARARLAAGQLPDPLAIRPEHFINAVPGDLPAPSDDQAFALSAEAGPSPLASRLAERRAAWAERLVLVAVSAVGRKPGPDERRPLRLTLAIDCSGSMAQPGGLERLQAGLRELVDGLRPDDRCALVAFGDRARVVLPATPGGEHRRLAEAIAGLRPSGSTNAAEGLVLAYQLAAEQAEAGCESRVLLATDGATLSAGEASGLAERLRQYRERGISLLVVGVGSQSFQAQALGTLANQGDGQFIFLGSDQDAVQAFRTRLMPANLALLARDAKLQVTWNPQRISHARLVGWDARRLAHADFRNDAVDAGEIQQDTRVTALFEVLLAADGSAGPLGEAQVRYHDLRLGRVQELSCPMPGALLRPQPSQRLRQLAAAAATAEWLQRGWWSNQRCLDAADLRYLISSCSGPHAGLLKQMVDQASGMMP